MKLTMCRDPIFHEHPVNRPETGLLGKRSRRQEFELILS